MSNFLSTGQIAKYCGVHLRTVIRWIEQGHLKGYKLPGRGNNRIEQSVFVEFLKANQMPIPQELQPRLKRALIIEDDVSMAKILMLILQSQGWDTLYASDGFQAGLALAKENVDLITLDLNMPTMDGFAVLAHIAQDATLEKMPVIVISAGDDELLHRAITAGATATLRKPFETTELIEIVNKFVTPSSKKASKAI